jgi:hypothetical protein
MKVIDLQRNAELNKEVRRYFPHQMVRGYQADLANRLYEALTAMTEKIRIVVVEAPTAAVWEDLSFRVP